MWGPTDRAHTPSVWYSKGWSAGGLVDRIRCLAVDVVLGDDGEAGLDFGRHLAPFEGGHSSVYAVLPDHSRLLGNQSLDRSLFEVLNLVWAGIEADNLDLRLLSSLGTPVAVPSAEYRLVPNTPTMSGSFCSADPMMLAAVAGSSWEYWTPRYLKLGSALAASSKPLTRASVVEMPGSTDMTIHLAAVRVELLNRLERSLSTTLVVRCDR